MELQSIWAIAKHVPVSTDEISYGSSTVLLALDVLEFIAHQQEAGITDIARALGTNKTRIMRVVLSLLMRGYVVQNEGTKKYRIGSRVAVLAANYCRNTQVAVLAQPFLGRLRDLFKATAILRALEGDTVVTIASEETTSDLKVTHQVGSRFPLARASHGKVLAAYMPEKTVRSVLESQGIARYTSKTIVGIKNFLSHLKIVRSQGFAFDDEEVERGVRSIAAPVRDASGKVIASIGVSAPSFLIPKSSISSAARLVKEIAAGLSAEFGWSNKETSTNKAGKVSD